MDKNVERSRKGCGADHRFFAELCKLVDELCFRVNINSFLLYEKFATYHAYRVVCAFYREDWKELFDFVIAYANKPSTFF